MAQSYEVVTGLDYPPNKRAEAGEIVDDLPGKSVKWLVETGTVIPITAGPGKITGSSSHKVELIANFPTEEE